MFLGEIRMWITFLWGKVGESGVNLYFYIGINK